MSSFLHTDALNHIEKHLDRFPLIKLDRILDWTPIEQYLASCKTRYLRDNGERPAYPLLSMFKAVLLSQWHSLSDPKLEYSLITRIDFQLLCRKATSFQTVSCVRHSGATLKCTREAAQQGAVENPLRGGTKLRPPAPQVPLCPGKLFRFVESGSAKPSESDLFEPAEGSQQA